MFLFRVVRWVVYIILVFIILLAAFKLRAKQKAKHVLIDFDREKVIALTFDDGPILATQNILTMLNELDVKATFFVLGDETTRRPELVRFAYENGHTIGSHSWNHPHVLGFRSKDYIEYQLFRAEDAIEQATGAIPKFFRAPFGETSPWLNWILEQRNQIGVNWTLALRDWKKDSSKECIAEIFEAIDKSEIILLHDRAYADPEKLATLRQSILDLQARGFTFVTIDELYR